MMARPLIFLVRLYQWVIAPALPPSCRFVPSCSQYMIDALREHGPLRGAWIGVRRILRCQPFCEGGYEPIPQRETAGQDSSPRPPLRSR